MELKRTEIGFHIVLLALSILAATPVVLHAFGVGSGSGNVDCVFKFLTVVSLLSLFAAFGLHWYFLSKWSASVLVTPDEVRRLWNAVNDATRKLDKGFISSMQDLPESQIKSEMKVLSILAQQVCSAEVAGYPPTTQIDNIKACMRNYSSELDKRWPEKR